MVKLGSKVRDFISGYEGIAVGRSVFLNGCVSICIEGALAKNDKGIVQRDDMWVDEQRVTVLEEDAFVAQGEYTAHERHEGGGRRALAGGPTGSTPPRDGHA